MTVTAALGGQPPHLESRSSGSAGDMYGWYMGRPMTVGGQGEGRGVRKRMKSGWGSEGWGRGRGGREGKGKAGEGREEKEEEEEDGERENGNIRGGAGGRGVGE